MVLNRPVAGGCTDLMCSVISACVRQGVVQVLRGLWLQRSCMKVPLKRKLLILLDRKHRVKVKD